MCGTLEQLATIIAIFNPTSFWDSDDPWRAVCPAPCRVLLVFWNSYLSQWNAISTTRLCNAHEKIWLSGWFIRVLKTHEHVRTSDEDTIDQVIPHPMRKGMCDFGYHHHHQFHLSIVIITIHDFGFHHRKQTSQVFWVSRKR